MENEQKQNGANSDEAKAPAANTGNASNPGPDASSLQDSPGNQLLDEKAEKYLREVASIEDVPDAQDQQEMDETLQETKKDDK
jgi:hypothetical protein